MSCPNWPNSMLTLQYTTWLYSVNIPEVHLSFGVIYISFIAETPSFGQVFQKFNDTCSKLFIMLIIHLKTKSSLEE